MFRLAKILAVPTVALALGAAVPTAEAASISIGAKTTPKPWLKNPARQLGKSQLTAGQIVTRSSPRVTTVRVHQAPVRPHPQQVR
jgi:hypothetical protein